MSTQARTSIAAHRRLAGATVLQIVSDLDNETGMRRALETSAALQHAGARTIVAGPADTAPEPFGGGIEWIAFRPAGIFGFRRNIRRLELILTGERIDIVHAHSAAAAWYALAATDKLPIWVVTTLPETLSPRWWPKGQLQTALGRGDHVIAHSSFAAAPMIRRLRIVSDRVTIIPHPIDARLFDPATMRPERVLALRHAWQVPKGDRVILVPGPITHAGGQDILVQAVRRLPPALIAGLTFMLMGDSSQDTRYARRLTRDVHESGLSQRIRFAGPCRDWPAAIAASDLVVMPTREPLLFGRPIPESQAMARPVVASAVGILPENLLAPPRIPENLRTGWLVQPDDPVDLARALNQALSLDIAAYRALVARARQFAEFMFSPQNTVASVLGVYSRLLSGDAK